MAYLIERKSQTIFVTATSIIANGKPRAMIVESRPEYAVVQLAGVEEKFPVPWEEVYATAKKRHEANLRLELSERQKRRRPTPSNSKRSNNSKSRIARRTLRSRRPGLTS